MIRKTIENFLDSDTKTIGLILGLLGICGCIAVYNAKIYDSNPFYFVLRQFLWVLIGLIIYFTASRINFKFYKKNIIFIIAIFWIPLIAVSFFGEKVNGMNGWFILSHNPLPIYVQPAELAKPAYILFLCWLCCKIKNHFKKFIYLSIGCISWILPIVIEPDFGTTLIYFAGFIIVLWLCGGKKRYFIFIFILALLASLTIMFLKPYVLRRFMGYLFPLHDPYGSGWHIMQFRYAMARGGLEGTGLGKAIWSSTYLPLSHTDSIFSSLTESLGLIGIIPILISFVLLIYLTFSLALQAKSRFVALFACSLVSVVVFQAFLHISVNVGFFPPTGITFPLVSYGGSSLIATMLGFGILLSAVNSEKTKN